MKLGQMLVRDGRVSEAQLAEVLAQQSPGDARLGTVLVEAGLIDLDTLTVYLGLELGIPIATGAMLERAKRSAVRLLSPAEAAQHRCVPLLVQDRQLIAAVDDPLDFENLDALTEITGYRIIPRVAPEIRVLYYVERFYGTPRPERFVKFGETPRGDQPAPAGLPAPPLPGLPPVPLKIVAPPNPAPHLRRAPSVGDFDSSEMLELEAEDLIVALESDDAAAAEATPLGTAEGDAAAPTPRVSARISAPIVEGEPLTSAEAIAAIEASSERGQIAEATMRFAAGMFEVGVLFVVRDNLAMGWRACGDGAEHKAHVEHILMPLETSSVLHAAATADDGFFDGVPADSTIHGYMYKVLGCARPARATVAMVSIGRRAVNILYGHRVTRPALTEAELDCVRAVCRAAAESYAKLIAASKQARNARR
ncbi:MAG: hypothetical protein R2939_07755 [Kofleriaceae bacterium]